MSLFNPTLNDLPDGGLFAEGGLLAGIGICILLLLTGLWLGIIVALNVSAVSC